ncbi:MAG: hypothetical protein WBO10_02665 [Pyrinomonadaceae bacterium]
MTALLFTGSPAILLYVLLAGILGLGIISGMLFWAFRGPKRPWTVPLAFLVIGLSICSFELFTDNFYGISFVLAAPWSLIPIFSSTIPTKSVGDNFLFVFIALNAAIIYLIARYRSNRKLEKTA